jgi:hypothetical protein
VGIVAGTKEIRNAYKKVIRKEITTLEGGMYEMIILNRS